jgi:hypothetical protein
MIIDKKFSIITYAGSLPLNLMAKDNSISSNPIKNNEWDKMIQAIDTIYATQRPDNTIPVFWTRRFSTVDSFGNISYRYAPHPESTLTKLDSKGSYYIILRDSSLTPLKIPSNGSLVLGYADTEDLPLVSPVLPDVTLSKDSFEYSFKPQIINLKPYESYNYSWKVIAGNWPVVTNTLSGILKPASSTGTINSSMTFCPTTGACSDKILSYSLPPSCSLEQDKDPFITLQLSVKSDATGAESLGDPFTITCNDCLPKPRINISGIDASLVVEPTDDTSATPSYSFQLNFNNLELDTEYTYEIEALRVDWPIVYVTPISGSFVNKTSNTSPIDGKFYFCPSTGLCPPNGTSIPAYDIPPYPKFLTSEAEYNIFLRAKMISGSADACLNDQIIYSDITRITYKKA